MRLALVGSPRTGNTWFRSVLAAALRLDELAVHNWMELGPLPENCILQIHWYREPNFQTYLEQNGFRVLSIARHPLDVLCSILAFIRHDPYTARWLGGNGDIPQEMVGCDPSSPVFLRWALGFGAENLLSISYQWWHDPRTIRVRYEDLIADPRRQFAAAIKALDQTERQLDNALASFSFATFKALPNRHGWHGRSGLWTQLFDAADASKVAVRHAPIFDKLGYNIHDGVPNEYDAIRKCWHRLG